MAHIRGEAPHVGHKRWTIQDWWRNKEWEHPWDAPTYDPLAPSGTQGGQVPLPAAKPMWQVSTGPGAAGLRQISKQIAGAGGWPGQGRGETQEAQMARIRRGREGAHDYPMALARDQWGMYGQAKKDIAAGKFESDPIEDEYDKLLKMLFLQSLLGGTAGGDPPNIGAVTVGSSRDFVPLPAMVPQPFGGYS